MSLTDPVRPSRLAVYESAGRAQGVAVAGARAFVANGAAGVVILDLSNPSNPVRVGTLGAADAGTGAPSHRRPSLFAAECGGRGAEFRRHYEFVNVGVRSAPVREPLAGKANCGDHDTVPTGGAA